MVWFRRDLRDYDHAALAAALAAGCTIGRDYPAPIVRHEKARLRTLIRYEAAKEP